MFPWSVGNVVGFLVLVWFGFSLFYRDRNQIFATDCLYKLDVQMWPRFVSTKNGLYLDHFLVSCIK